jgi:serine/threonine protein kinase
MVCGSLPFDDDSMSSLFNKIKEGRYHMPNYISSEVSDLINRMLQPNPVKRITMKEIKDHPWYLKNLPKYLLDLSHSHAKASHTVDMEIVDRIMNVSLEFPSFFNVLMNLLFS